MAGGFGSGPWGGSPWGGFSGEAAAVGPVDVIESVPVSDSVTIGLTLRVSSANAQNPFWVRVNFSANLDPGYLPNFQSTSYSIAGLSVNSVFPGPTASSVLIVTSEQGPVIYTVVVSDAQSVAGDPIDPVDNFALFAGYPVQPTFYATAQSRSKVQLTFSTEMLQNAAYVDPTSYTVMDLNGVNIPILSAEAVGTTPNRRLALEVGTFLISGGYYVATIVSPLVQTSANLTIDPPSDLFQWAETPRPQGARQMDIKISDFSGEVSGGILGEPDGLVFFSPSLNAPAPTSAIEVEEVSVCTRAYDVYTPPGPIDPVPLYTFTPGAPESTLGGAVLFTTFDRLLGAKLNVSLNPLDSFGPYTDGPAAAILSETWDPAYISLLNNSFWTTFDGSGNPFILANNLAPIPPGPIQVITLQGLPESYSPEGFGGDGWGAENWG